MPRRKREIGGEFKNQLHLSSGDLAIILSNLKPTICELCRARMGTELAIAFAYFRGDRRVRELQLKTYELEEDLERIQRAAVKLAALLHARPEAADAMARATHRELDKPNLVAGPIAPPVYQGKAVEIETAARRALASLPQFMPYVDRDRNGVPFDCLLEQLLTIWGTYVREAPTFGGDNQDNASPFVRFGLACCRHLGLRKTVSALSKHAARVYAALPGPKMPKPRRTRQDAENYSTCRPQKAGARCRVTEFPD